MLNDPELDRIAHIRHGFFTRAGGASSGIYNYIGQSNLRDQMVEYYDSYT